jgi:hypothetical protein
MSDDGAPKSALELAMERLRRKDRGAGVEADKPLSDTQRAAIAEARQIYDARVAEREILHHSQLARTADPVAREALDEEYRRDRERFAGDRDRKIEQIRSA